MASSLAPSLLLTLPRELREEIFGYLILPEYVYTSSSTQDTHNLHQGRVSEKSFVDTRVYLPSRLPANILATCRQLRLECLEHHAHLLNSASPTVGSDAKEKPMSSILAERLGTEDSEEAERACDDAMMRITIEVQRPQRGPMGYSIPIRDELSPRFMALLPLMNRARKAKIVIWPGYDWWSGGLPQAIRRIDKPETNSLPTSDTKRPNAASIAIGKILEHLPVVEELYVDVLMHSSEGGRWDLPDNKWEKVQPWLDSPVTDEGGQSLRKVVRRLAGIWKTSDAEAFYTQIETHQDSENPWKIERKGDMRTATLRSLCDPEDLDYLGKGTVDECFERAY
ncbi:Nn.00g008230.m01.CDS01 [Neocucurbitaria sp. VM-36]